MSTHILGLIIEIKGIEKMALQWTSSMGTNCVSLVAALFLFCCERHCMRSLAKEKNRIITQTCLCNILQYFTEVKTIIFR